MARKRVRGQEPLFHPDSRRLFYGDNLRILRNPKYILPESVDLIYLDPPFNSNQNYNVLFKERGGQLPAASQVQAFEDTWRWDEAAAEAYHDTRENAPIHVGRTLEALRSILDESDMFAYLCMMAPRLVELHRALRPKGSLYLHCDPVASHYLKVLLDSIFGPDKFQNEIIWCYEVGGRGRKRWGRKHDDLLFFSKSDQFVFNASAVSMPRKAGSHMKVGVDKDGREYQEKRDAKTGKVYRYYLDKGAIPTDWWVGIQQLNREAAERLGYPTQKPLPLLERIIAASSNPEDTVLDPFCGCGTTISAAHKLNRRWIGIDIAEPAIKIIRRRLEDEYGPEINDTYSVWGDPESVADAQTLAEQDPYQFQWWAVRRLGAREVEEKKGADKGIDGRFFLRADRKDDRFAEAIISVKAGHTGPAHVRELRGAMEREKAEVGVLVTLRKPTPAMRSEAASAGNYSDGKRWFPKLQLLTAQDIIEGKRIEYPTELLEKDKQDWSVPRPGVDSPE